jgi:hypothetical protein
VGFQGAGECGPGFVERYIFQVDVSFHFLRGALAGVVDVADG